MAKKKVRMNIMIDVEMSQQLYDKMKNMNEEELATFTAINCFKNNSRVVQDVNVKNLKN